MTVGRRRAGRGGVGRRLSGSPPPEPRRADARLGARPYLEALVQRDVRDVTGIDRLEPLPRLLRALAQIAGQMCEYNQLGGQVGLEHKTAARYVGVFEQMYRSWRLEPQPAVLKVAI